MIISNNCRIYVGSRRALLEPPCVLDADFSATPAARVMRVAIRLSGNGEKLPEDHRPPLTNLQKCYVSEVASYYGSKLPDCDEAMCHVESLAPILDEV